ncbi:hypothetical protein ACIQFP_02075 [Nocardiopsis alba]|uniref:Uncharacterized protein n=1 Tax=Nocardiopsis alba TaxID=53437 RepID=A0A7K2IQY2_9ACTN|nr:hypothetical protein [Nocardiopsis sp. LDBS1602]MYR32378.1 hypothetical protein [Nocardiopsis alba]
MGNTRGRVPRKRVTRVATYAAEIRLENESPNERADVVFDKTPVAYKVEGGIGVDGAWGSLEGSARAGSVVERASAALLSLGGATLPALAFGGLAHVVGAPVFGTLAVAGIVWTIALVVVLRITRAR